MGQRDRDTKQVDKGNAVVLLAKLLIKVSHTILMEKMETYALDDNTIKWFQNWFGWLNGFNERAVLKWFNANVAVNIQWVLQGCHVTVCCLIFLSMTRIKSRMPRSSNS